MLVLPVGVDGYINVPCRRMSSLLVSPGVEIHLAFDRVDLGRWASWWRWMVGVGLIQRMSSSDYTQVTCSSDIVNIDPNLCAALQCTMDCDFEPPS